MIRTSSLLSSSSRLLKAKATATTIRPLSTSARSSSNDEAAKPAKLVNLLQKHVTLTTRRRETVNTDEFKFYDPPYINREAAFPNYELLNVNLKGYDYSVLDNFYKFVEKLCDSLKVTVVEAYPMPARNYKIKTYQPFSSNLDKEYKLNYYHRVVRIQHLKSTLAPLLFETIQLNLPEGVQLNVKVPTADEDEFRYVPDIELNELKQQLNEMTKKPNEEAAAAAKKK